MKYSENKPLSFEIVFSLILLAPILFFLFGSLLGQSLAYLFSFISILLIPIILLKAEINSSKIRGLIGKQELETFIFFFLTFGGCLYLCLSWADFIAIGERLRDYALLGAMRDSPLQTKEPWMPGENLNYYLYWYRFAAFWSKVLGLNTWESYHILSAFSYSFFITSVFRLIRAHLGFSLVFAGLSSLLISFGSNIAGIISAYQEDHNWWGPSRVIKGVINEFPAWSFLLGDLHPHFLNLALTPFILCLASSVFNTSFKVITKVLVSCGFFCLAAPLYYNSNAWEVPMAGITFSLILGLGLIPNWKKYFDQRTLILSDLAKDFKDSRVRIIFTIILISGLSLFLSSKNIQPADYPWRWVKEPVAQSSFKELFQHWGLPLTLILASVVACIESLHPSTKILAAGVAISFALQSSASSLLLLALTLISLAYFQIKSYEDLSKKRILAIIFGLGISSLILIALGELIYLDDPYGGENERMNTVFKIYSACWAPLHIFAFIFSYQNFKRRCALAILAIATLPAFFFMTADLRKNQNPSVAGLSSADQEFQGSENAIKYMRGINRTVVLEAQGNPYSYTSFICTLGGHDCYLGWANHVGLLTNKHNEVSRREKITLEIYSTLDCKQKRELAKQEKIELIVIGHLEKQKYAQEGLESFDCMEAVYNSDQHIVYRP